MPEGREAWSARQSSSATSETRCLSVLHPPILLLWHNPLPTTFLVLCGSRSQCQCLAQNQRSICSSRWITHHDYSVDSSGSFKLPTSCSSWDISVAISRDTKEPMNLKYYSRPQLRSLVLYPMSSWKNPKHRYGTFNETPVCQAYFFSHWGWSLKQKRTLK